jgi:hypothetical protein
MIDRPTRWARRIAYGLRLRADGNGRATDRDRMAGRSDRRRTLGVVNLFRVRSSWRLSPDLVRPQEGRSWQAFLHVPAGDWAPRVVRGYGSAYADGS